MEAEQIVYTRRSTTTRITRRTSVSGSAASSNRNNNNENNENDHQIGAGAEVQVERSSKRRQPGNQRRKGAADNGAGAAERMFAASGHNSSAPPPTSVVVTRPSGGSVQLSQTQSDARHHHYQPEQQQPQQHLRNSDAGARNSSNNNSNCNDGQQQQRVKRLLIREPPPPLLPAGIRRLDNNYASGNIRFGCESGAAAPETSSSGQPRQQQQQQPRQQPQRMQTGGRPNWQQQQEQQLLLDDGDGDDDDDDTEERQPARNRHCDPHYYYHHYCDSQLSAARSLAAPALMAAADYDENIRLFATEHSNQPEQQQARPKLKRSHLSSSYSTPSIAGRHCKMATGRFVNYYPSWRQTQSPATCNTNQYSFHVPFEQQQQLHSAAGQRATSNNMQRTTRYGFVAPAERVTRDPNSASRQSFRSQEMLHLPSLLKLSCAPATPSATPTATAAGRQTPLVVDQSERSSRFGYENIDYAVEDSGYFQAAPSNSNSNNKSEPLLLCRPTTKTTAATADRARATSANYLNVHSGVRIAEAEGFDNPFKPGTQLSWEADMMVKLMARGYPIQELPQLIEAAKQVARARSHEQQQQQQQQRQPEKESAVVEQQLISGAYKRAPRKPSRQNAAPATTTIARDRIKSSDDLRIVADSSKQIWASSLSRAKSMPRFNAIPSDAVAANERDSDSIDKLIASIEKEMSEILLSQNPLLGKASGEKSKTLPGIYQGAPGKQSQDEQHVLEKEAAKTLSDTRLFNSAVRMPKLAGKQPKVSNNRNNNNNKTGNKSKNRRPTKSANRNDDDINNKSSGDLNDIDAASSQQQQRNQVMMKRSRSECCKIH